MLIHVSFQLESRGEIFDESVDLVKRLSTADGTDIGPTVRFLLLILKIIFFQMTIFQFDESVRRRKNLSLQSLSSEADL